MTPRLLLLAAAIAAPIAPAAAQTADPAAALPATSPDCSIPSGIGRHACVFPEGQIVIETDLADWSVDHGKGLDSTSVLAADTLVHVGVTHRLEVQVGWAPYDYERTRNLATGLTTVSRGVGDVLLGGKYAIVTGDESVVSVALRPTVTIPVGDLDLGGHGLGGSVQLPISYDVSSRVAIELTPEVDEIGDRDDDGRHLQYGATLGLDAAVSRAVSATLEYEALRDEEPGRHRTEQIGALSLSWRAARDWQVIGGVGLGLTRESPRSQVTIGFARRFR